MNRRGFIHALSLACIAVLLPGCASTGVTIGQPVKKGPPPHAPAHGYRRKNPHGLDMTFDSGLGVYIMMDFPMHYYWNGIYYRKHGNQWESSKFIDKKWKRVKKGNLPKGLQKK